MALPLSRCPKGKNIRNDFGVRSRWPRRYPVVPALLPQRKNIRNLTLASEAGGPADVAAQWPRRCSIVALSRTGKNMIPARGPQTAMFFVLAGFVLAVFVLAVFVIAARTK